MNFQPLTSDLVSSACRLSTQAGWEQTEEDWRRLVRLDCDGVWVWVDEGEVRASYSLVTYGGDVAWIGMILVDPAYRGKGFGKSTFDAVLAMAKARRIEVVGLDATNQGEPIYERVGFSVVRPIVRWQGIVTGADASPFDIREGLHEGIAACDFRPTQVDRGALLRDLADSRSSVFSIQRGGDTSAYGVVKESRTSMHLGPLVASSTAEAAAILDRAGRVAQGRVLFCDVLQPDAGIFSERGLMPLRHLKRMTHPRPIDCLGGDNVWCGAGFELG